MYLITGLLHKCNPPIKLVVSAQSIQNQIFGPVICEVRFLYLLYPLCFVSNISNVVISVKLGDGDSSKNAFIASAGSLEKWTRLSGLSEEVVGFVIKCLMRVPKFIFRLATSLRGCIC